MRKLLKYWRKIFKKYIVYCYKIMKSKGLSKSSRKSSSSGKSNNNSQSISKSNESPKVKNSTEVNSSPPSVVGTLGSSIAGGFIGGTFGGHVNHSEEKKSTNEIHDYSPALSSDDSPTLSSDDSNCILLCRQLCSCIDTNQNDTNKCDSIIEEIMKKCKNSDI
jgi:hypothetical protein